MKKVALLLTLMMALVLTACGGKTDEAEKTHYYEILDGAGETLYTVQDQKRVEQIDELVNTAGMEISHAGSAEGDPLYVYVCWQEATVHAGEDPAAEREYLEAFRLTVRKDHDQITTEVVTSALEDLAGILPTEDLGELLTFTTEALPDTAAALRDPAQFAE